MNRRVIVDHYTDLVIHKIEKVIKGLKTELNQYINSLNLGITAEQWVVLDTISAGTNVCQQDVAEALSKDKSNIKRIVEILEKKELITRMVGKKNNRLVNYLYITDNGKSLLDENIEKIKSFLETLFSPVSASEEQVLRDILKKLL